MGWILLIIAGILEICFTYCLGRAKDAAGETMFLWYLLFAIALVASVSILVKATKTIPLGTAYAVWTGIGAVGSVLVGIFFFGDPADFWRIFFISTLICSIVGLKFVSSH